MHHGPLGGQGGEIPSLNVDCESVGRDWGLLAWWGESRGSQVSEGEVEGWERGREGPHRPCPDLGLDTGLIGSLPTAGRVEGGSGRHVIVQK